MPMHAAHTLASVGMLGAHPAIHFFLDKQDAMNGLHTGAWLEQVG